MDDARAKQLAALLPVGADALTDIARTASRNKKALAGPGPYAERFHAEVIKLRKVENAITPVLKAITDFDASPLLAHLSVVRSVSTALADRETARRQIRFICETEVEPYLGDLSSPTQPASEPVLAAAVLAKAPTYLQRTLLQANGCYEERWYEASSVMIRKLVENLIIDVYERHKKEAEIKNKDGDYMMLCGLVNAMLGQPHWPLQRETKRALPDLKQLGDRG